MTTTAVETFTDVIHSRFSARAFLPDPVPADDIRAVLEDARRAPSHSNTQPWEVHVFSGDARDRLSEAMLKAFEAGQMTPDFTTTYGEDDSVHVRRSQEAGALLYNTLGIARDDMEGRMKAVAENLRFYGAPHVALLFVPELGDVVRAANDVGMYAQNFLLSLTARGYHGVPQGMHGLFADAVRAHLGLPADLKLLYGISFGTADLEAPLNRLDIGRAPLEDHIVLHDTSL
ncbi:nitroreductase [Nocardioides luteus]|uniref:Nitroreductase NfnB n=1 Tax=Nocardioides luteus TaxID=1844 RepID=A0ABQ5SY39_9ACTN|nr:nitroreductase [Nocardioides luteus]MDR7312846.1 nitroreductase [Nocardioides luteus]GGR47994.1 nitroreductase NfnB [Nocardioides luteus]GLJ69100.1 nitroreductase NfnB [Nocardioides luteus]